MTIMTTTPAARYDAAALLDFTRAVLAALDLAEADRQRAAEAIWQASLRGVDSHGIRLLPHYAAAVRAGRILPRPERRVERRSPTTALLHAGHGLGHAAAAAAMDLAVATAREHGSGFVAVADSSHCGAMAYYAELAADRDMIGLAFTHATARVVPPGAAAPFLGTNPFCFSAPMQDEGPLTYDAATSLLPFNKVRAYGEAGRPLPEGCATDAAGRPTRDPAAAAFLQPFGGYKGFGVGLFVEILCALLPGVPFGPGVSDMFSADLSGHRRIGHFFGAIDIAGFTDPAAFRARLRNLALAVRGLPKAEGGEDSAPGAMVPGDPEKRLAAERLARGIPLPEAVAQRLAGLGRELGVAFPQPRREP
ncbi:MAG: Ldh family oxidoreductase [Desulfovibrionaceae bacterium]